MKKQVKISVEGVDVNLHFPFSVLFKLGKRWGITSVNGVLDKVFKVCAIENGDVSLDALDVLSDVLVDCSENKISKESAIDYLGSNPKVILEIIELLVESITPANQGEQQEKEGDGLGK